MRTSSAILLLLVSILPIRMTLAQSSFYPGPELTITSGNTYGSVRPRIVMTTGDLPLVMWSKTSGQIFVSKWNGSVFTAPMQVNPTGVSVYTSSSEGPSIEAKGDTVYVTYFTNPTNASKIFIQASYDGGLTFQDTVRGDSIAGRHPYTPDVAIVSGGDPVVAFEVSTISMLNPEHFLVRSTDGGLTFSQEVSCTVSGPGQPCECCPPRIAAKDSFVYLVYRNNVSDIREMYLSVSSDYGNSFPTVLRLDTTNWYLPGCPSQGADILLTADSLLAVFMTEVNNESRIVMGQAHLTNLGIGENLVVDHQMTGTLLQRNPTISGSRDTIAVCWEDNRMHNNFNCYVTFSTSGVAGLGDHMLFLSDSLTSVIGNQVTPDVIYSNNCFHFVYQNAYSNAVIYRKACVSGTGIPEFLSAPILSFPNPYAEGEEILIKTNGVFQLQVIDVAGRVILTFEGENEKVLNLPHLPIGLYYLSLRESGGVSHCKSLIFKE